MGQHKNSRIGLCVICGPAFLEGRAPLGKTGIITTNTGPKPSELRWYTCTACDGKGYTHFRSEK